MRSPSVFRIPIALRTFLKVIAWNVGLLVAGIFVIELIFGSWFSAPQLWSLSIVRDWEAKFNVPNLYPRDGLVHYRRDEWGLRGDFGTPGAVNIVAIGGSTTDECCVSENETWAAVLQECLRERNIPATVANAGVGGQSSYGHRLNFTRWLNFIPEFAPELAVVLIGYNEQHTSAELENPHAYKGAGTTSKLDALDKWVKINSAVYGLFRIVKGNIRAHILGLNPKRERLYLASEPTGPSGVEKTDDTLRNVERNTVVIGTPEFHEMAEKARRKRDKDLQAYATRLEKLDRAIREFGSTPIYVTQNSSGYYVKNDGKLYGNAAIYFELLAFNNVTRNFCQQHSVFCVDLAADVFFRKGDLYDGIHSTPQGSRKIGEGICQSLTQWEALPGIIKVRK